LNWKPSKIFYGWWIVGAASIIGCYLVGSMFMGFTAFFQPIANEFDWSYTEVSLGFSIRSMALGAFAPLVGILVDRWGPRKLLFCGAIITACGLLLLSNTRTLAMFYVAFLLLAAGLGCCTLTVLMTAVANWFQSKAGLASGIVTCGFGSGGLLIQVVIRLISNFGWRDSLIILALVTLALCLPLSLLFRHKPEQYGYLPDGEIAKPGNRLKPTAMSSKKLSLSELLAYRPFWHLAITFTTFHMTLISIEAHVMPYLSSIGMTRASAGLIATAIPLISIIGSLGFGRLGDKIDRKKVALLSYIMAGTGVLSFALAPSAGLWILIPFLLLYGIGNGGCNAMRPILTRDIFGRDGFGTVFGTIYGLNSLIGATGPLIAGWAYDTWGGYGGIWYVFSGFMLISIISIITLPAHSVKENI
jgi:MFS transporter, OFA family, oxalate/formate antiporter